MNDAPRPGDEVWMKATVTDVNGPDGMVALDVVSNFGEVRSVLTFGSTISRTPPMSEQQAKVVEAAKTYVDMRGGNHGTTIGRRLAEAVHALEESERPETAEEEAQAASEELLDAIRQLGQVVSQAEEKRQRAIASAFRAAAAGLLREGA